MENSLSKISYPYGIMFHHFHDKDKHQKSQGSISASQFEKIICSFSHQNIITPEDWVFNLTNGTLEKNKVCITFDDNLKSQYDVAIKILNKYKLKAFFFVNTAIYEGKYDRLEIYRHFRENYFENLSEFYEKFFERLRLIKLKCDIDAISKNIDFSQYKADYIFYTDDDRKFRYFRDEVLGEEKYFHLMDTWLADNKVCQKSLVSKLWLSIEEIAKLNSEGHIIGLHTHTHPTNLATLNYERQKEEFYKNHEILTEIISSPIKAVSYPSGSYNDDTLSITRLLDIKVGFVDNINKGKKNSQLEIPRENHTNVLKTLDNQY